MVVSFVFPHDRVMTNTRHHPPVSIELVTQRAHGASATSVPVTLEDYARDELQARETGLWL